MRSRTSVLLVITACGGGAPPAQAPQAPVAAPAAEPRGPARCSFETDGVTLSILDDGIRTEKQALTTLVRAGAAQLSINAKEGAKRDALLGGVRAGVDRLRGAGYEILLDDAGTPPVLARAVASKPELVVAGSVVIDAAPRFVVCSFELDAGAAWQRALELCGSVRAAADAPPCPITTGP